jgi:hypothetical protein
MSTTIRKLTPLSLPQVDAAVDLIAQMVPAGNVPGIILSGLARLPGRRPPPNIIKRDVNLLFRGVEQALDKAVYGAVFAGPAAVIWGYQHLLKLVGKDPDDAFPEGTWQFYVDYALREDTARHDNETHGFDTLLKQHQVKLSAADRITAWVMTAIHCLHDYDALLENEWRERVALALLRGVTAGDKRAAFYAGLYRDWEKRRPYGRGPDSAPDETYPAYRRQKFETFVDKATADLSRKLRGQWADRLRAAADQDLPAYQQQMSILGYLEPGPYGETRAPMALSDAQIGVIVRGRYYLVPACQPGTNRPAKVDDVRQQIAAVLSGRAPASDALLDLATLRRSAIEQLRRKGSPALIQALDRLRMAPILINTDQRPARLPLSDVRQAERGIGDHALTIFDTGATLVFDQSHIFFDGAWGAALAEILTNEALSWAAYLHTLPPAEPAPDRPEALRFTFQPKDRELIQAAPRVMPHVSAESNRADVRAVLALRKVMIGRSEALKLTVNDLLVLYRAIHAVTYRPDPALVETLEDAAAQKTLRPAINAALQAIRDQTHAVILIPIDASQRAPRDRLFPMTFEVPLEELDLLNLHHQAVMALGRYQRAETGLNERYSEFDDRRRAYLAALAGFGAVMARARAIAVMGQSASVGTIKLLAHLPPALQRWLDQIPHRFDMLNDMIKGREVFSNVGAVVPTSTLTRFTTAKDDNEKKTLVWGVITDATGTMHLSLRDFRPHVRLLTDAGQRDLAGRIAQDYLDAYVNGLNNFVGELHRVVLATRDMKAG